MVYMINGTAHISRIPAFKKHEQQFREVTKSSQMIFILQWTTWISDQTMALKFTKPDFIDSSFLNPNYLQVSGQWSPHCNCIGLTQTSWSPHFNHW
jgi:hypothetical protein